MTLCPNAPGVGGVDNSFVYVAGKPFVTIVDETGVFELANMPEGDYLLTFQIQDRFSYVRRVNMLEAGETRDLGTVVACIIE